MNTALEFGYQFGETIINPVALGLTLLMGITLLLVPRRYVAIPILVVSFFITELQRIVLGGLDFPMIRILMLFGIVRVFLRKRTIVLALTSLDVAVILYGLSSCIMRTILMKTTEALIGQLGHLYDILTLYFFLKLSLVEPNDITVMLRSLCWVSAGIALSMLVEYTVGMNIFSVFGGVPLETIVRDGKMRCQGSFLHPILAGTFGATIFPLFAGLYTQDRARNRIAVLGMVSAFLIAFTSSSSGPLIALLAGMMGLALWPLRRRLNVVAASLVFLLALYSVARSAPFYRIILKFGVFGSSSTWHRYELIDNFVRRISEWWLVGTRSTSHWGWMMQDLANQYVYVGVSSGIVTLSLFIATIVIGFGRTGKLLGASLAAEHDRWFAWTVGCSLFAHAIAFLDVSYSGQLLLSWNMLLCMISVMTARLPSRRALVPQPV